MKEGFYHSLAVDADLCLGCAHCIRRCPTKALRIREGKASLRKDWCIDCGECLKVCPVSAIYVEEDQFGDLSHYRHRVVLFPAALFGQFPETESEEAIYDAIRSLGFTHLYPTELTAGELRGLTGEYIARNPDKPAISPFCPAVVRLIQTKFPELTNHIIPLRTPVEATAATVRRRLERQGAAPGQIGIFYVTPCAAKAAAIKQGDSGPRLIDGILNLGAFYNKICLALRGKHTPEPGDRTPVTRLSQRDMQWSMTGGEASAFACRSLSVDGIHSVADFLERLQTTGELHEIDFLELRACSRGCPGGALTPANRFLAEERLRNRASRSTVDPRAPVLEPGEAEFLKDNCRTQKPPKMTKLLYRGDIGEVLRQMNAAREIERGLPGIDCGACGSPTCRSLSNDVVRGEATPANCIFRQLASVRSGDPGAEQALRRMELIWGRERFEKKIPNQPPYDSDETERTDR